MSIKKLKKIPYGGKVAILEKLKALLRTHEEIIFALLYGSMVDPVLPGKYGDIDMAIYIRPEQLGKPEYILESQIEVEVINLLSSQGLNFPPIEVLVLNNAPYSFLITLFKSKYIVLKEDEEALTDFIEEVGERSMANSHLRLESLRELVGG